MSTIENDSLVWSVVLVAEAADELEEAPTHIRKKFDRWVVAVQALGPWLRAGWRTEALSGILKGYYSVRLNRKWRAVFEAQPVRRVIVIRIVAHDYKSIERGCGK